MKQMFWLGRPLSWKKDWRSISLTVDPHTTYPDNCPCIVAAWDKNIEASVRLSLAPEKAESGILIFQTPQSMCALGASREGLHLHLRVMGYPQDSFIPRQIPEEHIFFLFTRKKETYQISYSLEGTHYTPFIQGTLPGIKHSYSFGWYWSNPTDSPFEASADSFIVKTL